jgi:hypothetical protein
MAIETVGRYQLHLFAYELPAPGGWDAFLSIYRFSDEAQDFLCVIEKHRVSEQPYETYDTAIEGARRTGNAMIDTGRI